MKNLILILSLLSSLNFYAQQWVQQSNCGDIRYEAIDFTVNNEAYVVGGLISLGGNFVAYDKVWKYNDTTDSWSQTASYPGGNIYDGIAFVIDSIAYVGFGADEAGNRSNQLWAFNANTGVWIQKTNFPGTARTNAFSFAINGKGYIGAGDTYVEGNRTYLSDVWEYDPAGDSWTQKGSYSGGGRVGMTATIVNDRAYVGMGDDGFLFYTNFFEYEATNDDWILKATFPGSNRSFYAATEAYDKVYIMGGEDPSLSSTNEMWSYDPANDSWNAEFNFTGTARAAGNMFYLNGSFYYGLGLIGANSSQGSNEIWKHEISGLGTHDHELTEFAVYPNPANTHISIKQVSKMSDVDIQLMNLQGQLIRKWFVKDQMNSQLNIDGIPAGTYVLSFAAQGFSEVKRITIY